MRQRTTGARGLAWLATAMTGLALASITLAGTDAAGLEKATAELRPLEIHIINVQQGASALVIGPNGTTILLDAGDNGKGTAEVLPYLESIGLAPSQGLDYTIASHLHDDHIGGFDEVIGAVYDVRTANWYNAEVELPLADDASAAVKAYFEAAGKTSAQGPMPIPLGRVLPLGDGATLTVVAAGGEVLGHGFVPGAENNENDLSVAVLIQYGAFDFLWAGDLGGGDDDEPCTGRSTNQVNLETPLARTLTGGGLGPRVAGAGVEVLHVNHHGAESSTNSDWMNLLRPRVAVIPVGAHRGFRHPRTAVVDNVLLGLAPCVTAPPALVLQTDEGPQGTADTSYSGYVVGDIRIVADGGSSYRVEAGGDVRNGLPEREQAGLPARFCLGTDTALCLNDDRFQVTVRWQKPDGQSGDGQALPLTDDTGYFWFFREENVELVVKVLNACVDPYQKFWVFAAGLTNVQTRITVTDTVSGAERVYDNPQRAPFQPLQDTKAFDCADNQGPEASFEATCNGLSCQFTDTSSDADGTVVGWSWNFGDGGSSLALDPDHAYATGGGYLVSLTVTDDLGATDTATQTVTVTEEEPDPPKVVLSEVFYNAVGSDEGLEWVEIYNAGTTAVDLSAFSLGNGGDDYTVSKVQLSGVIGPGQTFVVGGPSSTSKNGFPIFDQVADFEPNFQNAGDQGDGVALFNKRTSQVTASTVPIDAVIYGPNNAGGLIDETGTANPPEVGNAPAGASIERTTLAGTWQVRATPNPGSAPGLP